MLQSRDVLDGYRVIRPIGRGGFGEVWLCQSEALGDLRALKFVHASDEDHLHKEFEALSRYRAAVARLRSPAIMPIEHANVLPDGLFYVMPLADGAGDVTDPSNPDWQPLTLAALLEIWRGSESWLSSTDIKGLMAPILHALQLLSEAGLVHRDVKPDNILFLGGAPCLADISLLGEDHANLTRRGTPGYTAPSWYVESGGPPDMFGAATTLYALLTGNPPDKLGRSAFRWPPPGEASLAPEEHAEWLRLHGVIRRAVDERGSERFPDFITMARAVTNESAPPAPAKQGFNPRLLVAIGVIVVAGAALAIWGQRATPASPQLAPTPQPTAAPQPTPSPTLAPATPLPTPEEQTATPDATDAREAAPVASPLSPSAEIPAAYRDRFQKFYAGLSERLEKACGKPEAIVGAVDAAVAALKQFEALKPADPEQAVQAFEEIHRQFAEAVEKLPRVTMQDVKTGYDELDALKRDLRGIAENTGDLVTFQWKIEPSIQEAQDRFANALARDATLRSKQSERLLNPLNKVSDQAGMDGNEPLAAAVWRFRDTADKLPQRY